MKRVLTFLMLIAVCIAMAQTPGGPTVDAVKMTDKVTTSIRLGWTPAADERPLVFDEDLKQLYQWTGSAWQSVGGGSGGMATEDQTIPAGVTRIINTGDDNAEISYRQNGTEVMRIGGNNDVVPYVNGLEAIPGGSGVIQLYTPLSYSNGTSGLDASTIRDALDELANGINPDIIFLSRNADQTINDAWAVNPGNVADQLWNLNNTANTYTYTLDATFSSKKIVRVKPSFPGGVMNFVIGAGSIKGNGADYVNTSTVGEGVYLDSLNTGVLWKDGPDWFFEGPFKFYDPAANDPTNNANYLARFDPTSIGTGSEVEDDALTTWNNLNTSKGDMTLSGTILHIESGQRQVDFDGSNDYGSWAQSEFNPDIGVDEFTVAFRIGYRAVGSGTETIVGKSQINLANGEFTAHQQSSSIRTYIGGTTIDNNSETAWTAGGIWVITVRSGNMDVYLNDVKIEDNVAIGTADISNDWIIGASYQGATYNFDGALSHFYIKDQAIDATEATSLYNWMNQ